MKTRHHSIFLSRHLHTLIPIHTQHAIITGQQLEPKHPGPKQFKGLIARMSEDKSLLICDYMVFENNKWLSRVQVWCAHPKTITV